MLQAIHFSARYKSKLAMCFSPFLSFTGVKGKSGTHSFTSNADKVRIETLEFKGRKLTLIHRSDPDDAGFKIDNFTGKTYA
jgi:Golgi nucleoside diphosphatase